MFEVHAEKEKIIGNLDFPTAIAAFLHLCFVVNLKYPKVSIFILLNVDIKNLMLC